MTVVHDCLRREIVEGLGVDKQKGFVGGQPFQLVSVDLLVQGEKPRIVSDDALYFAVAATYPYRSCPAHGMASHHNIFSVQTNVFSQLQSVLQKSMFDDLGDKLVHFKFSQLHFCTHIIVIRKNVVPATIKIK